MEEIKIGNEHSPLLPTSVMEPPPITPLLTVAPLPMIAATTPRLDLHNDLRPHHGPAEWRFGLVLALVSGILFTANNFFIQFYNVDSLELLLVRSVIQSIVLGIVVTNSLYPGDSPAVAVLSNQVKMYSLIQAVFGGLRLFFTFTCLAYMPLGDALTLIFTEPLFTIVMSLIFLRIKIGFWKAVLCCGLLGGMILSIQPPFLFPVIVPIPGKVGNLTAEDLAVGTHEDLSEIHNSSDYFFGATMAVCTAICGALGNILITKCHDVQSTVLVFLSGLAGVGISLVGCAMQEASRMLFDLESLTVSDWAVLIMISVVGILGYFAMTESLKFVSPTSVSVLRALEIVLAYGCQVIVMGIVPNLTCIIGASLVMLSVVGIAVQEKI